MGQSTGRPHVGIIMDGNGRWAAGRGLPRLAGHQAGAAAVRRVVEAAPRLGIGTLTLYAFSADNWQRPLPEVNGLMQLFGRFLRDETERAVRHGVRLAVIGRRDRLSASLQRAIEGAEQRTAGGTALLLRVAVDYSGRDAIRRAALRLVSEGLRDCSTDEFGRLVGMVDHAHAAVPAVDVLIRTGGDQRLSDFLLWECAYAELFFRREPWPEFGPGDLSAILTEFSRRERRFGALPDRGSGGRVGSAPTLAAEGA